VERYHFLHVIKRLTFNSFICFAVITQLLVYFGVVFGVCLWSSDHIPQLIMIMMIKLSVNHKVVPFINVLFNSYIYQMFIFVGNFVIYIYFLHNYFSDFSYYKNL